MKTAKNLMTRSLCFLMAAILALSLNISVLAEQTLYDPISEDISVFTTGEPDESVSDTTIEFIEYYFGWEFDPATFAEGDLIVEYYFGWEFDPETFTENDLFCDLVIEYYFGWEFDPETFTDNDLFYGTEAFGEDIGALNVGILVLSTHSSNFTSAASNATINVTSNRTWSATSNVNWLTVSNFSPANRTGNGSFRINATANPNTFTREGTITVTAPGATTRTVSVRQDAVRALTLSTASWNPTSAASNALVNVSSNTTWSVTSNASWLTVSNFSPANRTGTGSFRINTTANTGTTERVGTITATAPGAPTRQISVRQAPPPATLALSTNSWNTTPVASFATINVTSNRTWSATSNASWLTVSNFFPTNRTGSGSFRINIANLIDNRESTVIQLTMAYPTIMRERALEALRNGHTKKKVNEMFGLGKNTLKDWEELKEETGSLEKRPLDRKPLKIDRNALIEYYKENPDATEAEAAVHFNCHKSGIHHAKKACKLTHKKRPYST